MMDSQPMNFDYEESRKRFYDLVNKADHELLAIIASKLMDREYDLYTDKLSRDINEAILVSIARAEAGEYHVDVSARADGVRKFRGYVTRRQFDDMEELRLKALTCGQELAGRLKSEIKEWDLGGISVTVTKCMHSLLDG